VRTHLVATAQMCSPGGGIRSLLGINAVGPMPCPVLAHMIPPLDACGERLPLSLLMRTKQKLCGRWYVRATRLPGAVCGRAPAQRTAG